MSGKFKTMTLISEAELQRLKEKQLIEYNPLVRSMTKIQDIIDELFEDTKVPDYDKQKLLSYLQNRLSTQYRDFKNSTNSTTFALPIQSLHEAISSPDVTAQGSSPPIALEDAPVQDIPSTPPPVLEKSTEFSTPTSSTSRTIISIKDLSLPAQYTNKLSEFSKFLSRSSDSLHSNSNNELVIDGKVLSGSSFTDLMRSMYVINQKMNLAGYDDFIKKLSHLNADPKFFSNAESIKALQNTTSAKSSFTLAPSKGQGIKRKRNAPSSLHLEKSHPPPGKRARILHLFYT